MMKLIRWAFNKNSKNRNQGISDIQLKDVLILPKGDGTKLNSNLRKVIYETLESYQIIQNISKYSRYFIRVSNQIAKEKTVIEAYNVWKEPFFSQIKTPFNLPRKNGEFICPENNILVQLECIHKYTPNMGSYWGFEGYILIMLVDIKKHEIIDARGEKTK